MQVHRRHRKALDMQADQHVTHLERGSMRKRVSGFVNVRAISGTYVVFLAFDMKESEIGRASCRERV